MPDPAARAGRGGLVADSRGPRGVLLAVAPAALLADPSDVDSRALDGWDDIRWYLRRDAAGPPGSAGGG